MPSREQGQVKRSHPRKRPSRARAASTRRFPFLVFALLLSVVVLIAISLLLWQYNKRGGDLTQGVRLVRAQDELKGFPIQQALAQQYHPFNSDYALRVTFDYVTYMDEDGNASHSYRVYLNDPEVLVQGDYAFVYDHEGLNYYLFDEEGLHLYGEASAAIQGAALTDQGDFLLLMQDTQSRGILRVMGANGNHRFDREFFDLENSGFLVHAQFTPDGTAVDISLVNTDGLDVDTIFHRISLVDYLTTWHHRIEDGAAMPLMSHDAEGALYASDGQAIWQISEFGAIEWLAIDDAYDAILSDSGAWILDQERQTLDFHAWTSDGLPASSQRSERIRLTGGLSTYHPQGRRILIQQDDGKLVLYDLDRSADAQSLPMTASDFLRAHWTTDGLQIITERQVHWLDIGD